MPQHEVLVTPKRGVALLYFQLGESIRSLYFTRFGTQWSLQSIDVTTPSQHMLRYISEILPFSILIAVGDVMRAVKICRNVRQPSADSRGIAFSPYKVPGFCIAVLSKSHNLDQAKMLRDSLRYIR